MSAAMLRRPEVVQRVRHGCDGARPRFRRLYRFTARARTTVGIKHSTQVRLARQVMPLPSPLPSPNKGLLKVLSSGCTAFGHPAGSRGASWLIGGATRGPEGV